LEIFNRIKIFNKFYIEFGAWDGLILSNTANLRLNKKWDGILFELDICKVNSVKLSNLYCEKISSDNINEIFRKYKVPFDFGLLSIDIDGNDSYCWQSLSDEYKPNIVIIEFNPGLPNKIPIRIKENEADVNRGYFGSNINHLYDLGINKGYEFVTITDWNIIFIRKELFPLLNIPIIIKDKIITDYAKNNGFDFWRNLQMTFGKNDLWVVN